MKRLEALLKKTEEGFGTLDLSQKYKDAALEGLRIWLTDRTFADYAAQIEYLIETEKWGFLLDSFYQVIPFGTGGRRGLVGIGPNRINVWTIQASAQGHAQYLVQRYGAGAKQRGVVLTYDVRKYTQKGIYDDTQPNPVMDLDCKELALAAAKVYAANGIKVFTFDGVRSTPELSFAIRHLQAVSGDMFSASHNLPTDNGKKVYDQHGGQLIPPYDQILVDEVTKKVAEIKAIELDQAHERGLIEYVGASVDQAYHEAVRQVSLSQERGIKILYSPLHGTGLTSVYPVLKNLGFDVTLDPKTSNLSGAFEHVTFNIPNPEVEESFDTALPAAEKIGAEIVINTDPDADRIGVMVRQRDAWRFLSGNEIGVLLTDYGISKYKARGLLHPYSTVIKTDVTTALIERIAQENGIRCIGDLLVGFKYIGEEMNKLEREGKIDGFILGTEESHGILIGNYCRDKDAAGAAVWICEYAAELKKKKKTLLNALDEIYARYGYCHNYLTEIRLLGAKGMEQITSIMDHLRQNDIAAFGRFRVSKKQDRWQGEPQPHVSPTDTASRNVLIYHFDNDADTSSLKATVRPSGTEPKIKMYFEVFGKPFDLEKADEEKEKIVVIRKNLEKAFMQYCYKILGIDFPERGFLLFWQLPLSDKLKYFEIEDDLAKLKDVAERGKRKEQLDDLLAFLGADPVEKVDDAFKERYQVGILEFLGLDR